MHKATLALACGTLFGAACSGTSGPYPAGGLAFGLPSAPEAAYHIADTLEIFVDSPLGNMEIKQTTDMTVAMAFERAPSGVEITATVTSLEASMSNPMAGPISADTDDVEGALVFVVGRRGAVEVSSMPEIAGAGGQLSNFTALAQEFILRLPDRSVGPGDTWLDTVSYSASEGGADMTTTTAYTYTLAGDTVVDGRSLLNITIAGDTEIEIRTSMAGMDLEQAVGGTTTGHVMWDVELGLPHSSEIDRDLSGTVSVPSMGIPPMPVTVRGPLRARIQP